MYHIRHLFSNRESQKKKRKTRTPRSLVYHPLPGDSKTKNFHQQWVVATSVFISSLGGAVATAKHPRTCSLEAWEVTCHVCQSDRDFNLTIWGRLSGFHSAKMFFKETFSWIQTGEVFGQFKCSFRGLVFHAVGGDI